MVRVQLPITYKQLLETRNLQKHVIHKPINKNELVKNYKTLKQMQETTLVYLLFDGIGPPCLDLKKHLSLGWGSDGSMEMEERECGWLERQRVSRHPLRNHNSMQGRSDLRVTPTPLFIAFLGF